ncbi:unnamed protein product [Adineta steineri]|uniref:Protein kinase domain-containing protein n=1 Tax=Adineta steineri TaxID=433720 RepID=A0A816CVL4_9BILA|nr:unnamed protein product [Adineta steineri]CAF1629218.1 unnamed protein product [Adineta steineri]
MGANKSKSKFEELEEKQNALMKQNADMAKRLAEQEEANKRQHEATVGQIAKMILVLAQSDGNETVIRNENREVEIEGVTYELIQFVNRGGFGEVHKAKVKTKNEIVAIKIMKNTPGLQEEVKNEINFLRLTKRIAIDNHPIIEYYGSKLTNEGIFIAMELAACDLLTFWMDLIKGGESDKLNLYGIIIMVYVLRALTFLEKLNIVHGDIKPQNLVIVPDGDNFCIKLIDFGTVEKMNTRCAQMTVDITKGFTLFFVSPEFLQRDSKNIISRHLHKKSDVWAAGVMFYLLFCGQLPWEDQYDYENFCNDKNGKDIVIPDIGGYKMIIELLLKKNPDHRSTAKATLMQLKAHPVFGTIVKALHEKFCPVDDVCYMKVPDDVRQGLLKLARPGHMANASNSSSTAGSRRYCRYGRECYNKDTDHRKEFVHPNDADYHGAKDLANHDFEKPACRYGKACFRTDQDHLKKFSHPGGSTTRSSDKQWCRYGADCYNNDTDHREQFIHSKNASQTHSDKQTCRFGKACTKYV